MVCTAHRVRGEWKKLHIDELNDLYCSPCDREWRKLHIEELNDLYCSPCNRGMEKTTY